MSIKERLYTILRMGRRLARYGRWGAHRLRDACSREGGEQALLLVYDFSSQPFSVGDILTLQEAALVCCEENGLRTVDIALVYEPSRPVVSDPAFRHLQPEDFLFHLSSVLPAAQVNPLLRSLMLFGSHRELEKFVADNGERYVVWPTLGQYASREYLFYHCMDKVFQNHFDAHGHLPQLRSRPAAAHWAKGFLQTHAPADGVTVSIQLRRNQKNSARNSDYEAWKSFFAEAAGAYSAKFFVICGPTEIDPEFRKLPNVVLVKDYYTSLEQDLALIETCEIHMGASSGPGMIAIFNRSPYCFFGYDGQENRLRCLQKKEGRLRFSFAEDGQYLLQQIETPLTIRREFELLWKCLREFELARVLE
jgi:hypothetical protein